MSFLGEAREITGIKQFTSDDNNTYVEISLNREKPVCLTLSALQIHLNTEIGGIHFFQDGVYATSWFHVRKFLTEQGITLPPEKIPCKGCDGGQCFVLCDRDEEKTVAKENAVIALSA